MSTPIEEAFDLAFRLNMAELGIELAGWQMRDASLEDVEHYFVYHADLLAEVFLG